MENESLCNELRERGLIAQEGGGDLTEILSKKRKMYVGVEPSSDSIHMGNLVPIILLKHLADDGHEPYLLVGGATGLIGDPKESGERPLLDEKTIKKNSHAIDKQLSRILKSKVVVFNNADWLKKISLIDFLRDVGKHFTVNNLIKRDIIKRRLQTEEDSISYTEFSYSLLQGYDFMHLNQKKGIDLQIGGSDQWSNIISGVDLIRRNNKQEAFALTTPIIVDKTTGKKFGKSEGNAVWIDPQKTSPFAFYQFWINTDDENVEDYLKIFTFLPLQEIKEIITKHNQANHLRTAQKTLAKKVTEFVHGREVANTIERVSSIIYGVNEIPDLTIADKKLILQEAPSHKITKHQLKEGWNIIEVLTAVDLANSKSEARRLVEGQGVKINGKSVNLEFKITTKDFHQGLCSIRKGKKVAFLYV